jgi:hypothetical protein
MHDQEHDEFYHDDIHEKCDDEEWFEDDCKQRTRDMQEALK